MVESGGLENRCPTCGTVGSNPTLSAPMYIGAGMETQKDFSNLTINNMKQKILFLSALVIFFFSVNINTYAQDYMDFEEFMGMMSETMTLDQLDELSFQLPWDITVMGYGYGDFSNDGANDIVISIREKDKTPKNSVDVYFFENIGDKTFNLIKKKNYKYFEITLEVAFLVKEGKVFVTNRDDNFWYFTGYAIDGGKLKQLEKDKYPIEFEKAGE